MGGQEGHQVQRGHIHGSWETRFVYLHLPYSIPSSSTTGNAIILTKRTERVTWIEVFHTNSWWVNKYTEAQRWKCGANFRTLISEFDHPEWFWLVAARSLQSVPAVVLPPVLRVAVTRLCSPAVFVN